MTRKWSFAIVPLLVIACAEPPDNKEKLAEAAVVPEAGSLLAAWTQVVPKWDTTDPTKPVGTKVEARWVLQGTQQSCPGWTVSPSAGAGAGAQRQGSTRGGCPANDSCPDRERFNITVCTASLDDAWADVTLSGGGQSRPLKGWGHVKSAVAAAQPVVILGDSGCRSGTQQTCASSGASPQFAKIVTDAAKTKPALYLHGGDYRYTGEKAGDPDRWQYWHDEFLGTVSKEANLAPWVLARGNHERCGENADDDPKNGTGWWWLMGPDSKTQCKPTPTSNDNILHPTWWVDIQPAGGPTHRFVVIDTAYNSDDALTDRFRTALAASRANKGGYTRWLQHYPLLGLLDYHSPDIVDDKTRAKFAAAVDPSDPPLCDTTGVCSVSAMLVSHQHFYQKLTFNLPGQTSQAWPDSVILPSGGVNLYDQGCLGTNFTVAPKVSGGPAGWQAKVEYQHTFGYLTAVLDLTSSGAPSRGWTTAIVPIDPSSGGGTPCTGLAWALDQTAAQLGFPTAP